MPKTIDQQVPPEFLARWERTFVTGYFQLIGINNTPTPYQTTRRAYPPTIEPPRVPSPRQLAARAALTTTANLLEAAPQNEKHAYYLLSAADDMRYASYYAHRNLSLIYHDQGEEDIVRPDAWTVQPHFNGYDYQPPYWLVLRTEWAGEMIYNYDLEFDPGTPKEMNLRYSGDDGFYHDDKRTFQFGLIERLEYNEWPNTIYRVHELWNPTARFRDQGTIVSPPARADLYQRYLYFFYNITQNDRPAIAWQLCAAEHDDNIDGWCFEQNTEVH